MKPAIRLLLIVLLMAGGSVALVGNEAAAADETTPGDTTANKATADASDTAQTFTRQEALLASLTIFVLAIFIGFEVITKVPPTLHTPLMSGSNAISGITVVGALIAAGVGDNLWVALLGGIAVAMATVNVIGGFLVTHRMLAMFKKKK